MVTPDVMQLRKGGDKQLYTVLEQKETAITGMYGSSHGYQIPGEDGAGAAAAKAGRSSKNAADQINVTFNPSELEHMQGLNDQLIRQKYDEQVSNGTLGIFPVIVCWRYVILSLLVSLFFSVCF